MDFCNSGNTRRVKGPSNSRVDILPQFASIWDLSYVEILHLEALLDA